jgi:3-hydroxyisobutyrate dehydrogenase
VPDSTLNVGFIGLGDMGGRIAKRIAAAGFPTYVYDTRSAAREALAACGAYVAADAASTARTADVVCICVVDDAQVIDVVTHQLHAALPAGSVLMVHSSVAPDTVRSLAATLSPAGVAVVDAPVSGSRPAADAGTLTAMAGGDPAALATVRPVLDAFCANVITAGPVGAGQALKIANNVMLHMNHLVALEAVRFARSEGIDEDVLIRTTNVSTGRSWVTETWGLIDAMLTDHPLAGTDAIYPLMSKEMWHAVELGRRSATSLPLTALGTQISEAHFRQREAEMAKRTVEAASPR